MLRKERVQACYAQIETNQNHSGNLVRGVIEVSSDSIDLWFAEPFSFAGSQWEKK